MKIKLETYNTYMTAFEVLKTRDRFSFQEAGDLVRANVPAKGWLVVRAVLQEFNTLNGFVRDTSNLNVEEYHRKA